MNTLQALRQRFNTTLSAELAKLEHIPPALHDAITYSCIGGGKRLRPILAYLVAESLGCSFDKLDLPVCALELIHIYALVHDDLPCMDDAPLRHGKASSHSAYNEATAVLVGDGLQALAFTWLSQAPGLDAETRLALIATLSTASGPSGMVGGQYLDLHPPAHIDRNFLQNLHDLKTGRLIRAAAHFGLIVSGCKDKATYTTVQNYATYFGLAYQAQDDLLDSTSKTETLGKPAGQDIHKHTTSTMMSLTETKQHINDLWKLAQAELDLLGNSAKKLLEFTGQIKQRDY
jgi:geranylgeranyl pyrophosphate synthase